MKILEKNEATNSNSINASAHEIVKTHHLSDVERYFTQYQHFAVKTAKSTIEMCRVVFEAKQQLKKDDFSQFCTSIAHKSEDSIIRKYLAIGARYQQLIDCAELLPNSWTSIYLITQIPAETFNALVATSSDMSSFTGKDIQKLIDGSKNSYTEVDESSTSVDSTAASSDVSPDVSSDVSSDMSSAVPSAVSADATADVTADFSDLACAYADTSANASDALDETTSSIDHDAYSKKATDQMFDHVSSRILSNDLDDDNDDDDIQSAYEVNIRFSHRPSDDAINEVVKSLVSIREKYNLNFEIDTNTIEHV